MGDLGFRISADGVDVKSGADKDMIVTSKLSMLKGSISGNGTISVPQNGADQIVTIAHGLGYIPMVQAFWNDRDGDLFSPTEYYTMPIAFIIGGTEVNFVATADDTNVYLDFYLNDFGSGGSNVDINYSYYIFIDKGLLS